jgi:hypothetical protein
MSSRIQHAVLSVGIYRKQKGICFRLRSSGSCTSQWLLNSLRLNDKHKGAGRASRHHAINLGSKMLDSDDMRSSVAIERRKLGEMCTRCKCIHTTPSHVKFYDFSRDGMLPRQLAVAPAVASQVAECLASHLCSPA